MNTIQQELSLSQQLDGSGYRDCRRREGRDHPRHDLIRVTVAFLVKMTNVEGEHLERSAGGKVKEGSNWFVDYKSCLSGTAHGEDSSTLTTWWFHNFPRYHGFIEMIKS